jgi:hypothetical protein
MDRASEVALGLVEAGAAREHEVGAGQELRLEDRQYRGSVREAAQLVHAVVHDCHGLDVMGPAQGDRGVVPEDRCLDTLGGKHLAQEPRNRLGAAVRRAFGDRRNHDREILRDVLDGDSGRLPHVGLLHPVDAATASRA